MIYNNFKFILAYAELHLFSYANDYIPTSSDYIQCFALIYSRFYAMVEA